MAQNREPFLAWPAPADLRFGLLLCVAFFLFFELTYVITNYLTGLHHFRIHVHSDSELRIPFVPAMAVVYVSLNVMLGLAPFVLRTWRAITPLCVVMTFETLICAVFFVLLPVQLGYAPVAPAGGWGKFCAAVSSISLQHNNFPSLHVAFAFTAAMAFGARCDALGRGLLLFWAALIAASTILIHEHHVADVAAGIALSAAMLPVYCWASAPEKLEALRLEMGCLREFRHMIFRHRRYLFTLLVIYKYSIGRWRQTRIIRAGYCLTQHVDDVLDGDRDIGRDPEEYVRDLVQQISTGHHDEASFVSSLARYVVTTLRTVDADRDLLALFDLLLFDRRRLRDRLLLTSEALREHHRLTFFYSLNLTLIACGAELRAADASDLIAALAWCSIMRDLEEDLAKGLINIPAEVLEQAACPLEYGALIRTKPVRNWIRTEYLRGMESLQSGEAQLEHLQSREGTAILDLFLRAIRVYARKYAREHRDILTTDTAPPLHAVRGDESCQARL